MTGIDRVEGSLWGGSSFFLRADAFLGGKTVTGDECGYEGVEDTSEERGMVSVGDGMVSTMLGVEPCALISPITPRASSPLGRVECER